MSHALKDLSLYYQKLFLVELKQRPLVVVVIVVGTFTKLTFLCVHHLIEIEGECWGKKRKDYREKT